MLFCGLRSAEVLALHVEDIDIARGWARVAGKGGREPGKISTGALREVLVVDLTAAA